jgi:hypothetical protein
MTPQMSFDAMKYGLCIRLRHAFPDRPYPPEDRGQVESSALCKRRHLAEFRRWIERDGACPRDFRPILVRRVVRGGDADATVGAEMRCGKIRFVCIR